MTRPSKNKNADHSVVGYVGDSNNLLYIPYSMRQNMAIFGEIGSGKSSILRMLILQDIQAKRGFLLAENHSELSREILALIPPKDYHKVVYVHLGSLRSHGKTLRFNPLASKDVWDHGMTALTFTECLAMAFSDSWGARVDTCARNGAQAVIGTQSNTIGAMLRLLTDQEYRHAFVPSIQNRQVKHFFEKVYDEQYPKEAGGVIFNKLNKMMTTPEMDAMFNSSKSTIDFKKIMDDGMYVVLDFGGGLTADMVKFLGNVFLHLFYSNYRKRSKVDGKFPPFNVYLDEVQMLSPNMTRELLNTVRKYGIKMTIATQSVSALDRDLADEIATLCRAVACFRCDAKTATHLKSILPKTVEEQQVLSWHTFSFFCGGDRPITAVAKTRHLQVPDRWEDAAMSCIDRFGEHVTLDKYYATGGNADVLLTPLEFGILNYLRTEKRDCKKKEITDHTMRRYGVDARAVSSALNDVLIGSHQFAKKHDVIDDDGDKEFESRYAITSTAIKMIFSKAAAGRRAGSDLHLATIFMIMDTQMNLGNYCVADLGSGAAMHADLLIFTPKKVQRDGKDVGYNPSEWSDDVVSLEVETAPGKHLDQVVKNYEKNHKMGYRVWFVTFAESDREKIINMMKHSGVPESNYDINVINPGAVIGSVDTKRESVQAFSQIETAIQDVIIRAGGRATEGYIHDNVWQFTHQNVKETLQNMRMSGRLEFSEPEMQDPGDPHDHTSIHRTRMWSLPGYSPDAKVPEHKPSEKRDLPFHAATSNLTPVGTNFDMDSEADDTMSDSDEKHLAGMATDTVEPDTVEPDATEPIREPAELIEPSLKSVAESEDVDYSDLTEHMLFYIFEGHRDGAESDDERKAGMDRVRATLKKRGFVIKKRGGIHFLSKISGKK